MLVPGAVLVAVGLGTTFGMASGAGAQTGTTTTGSPSVTAAPPASTTTTTTTSLTLAQTTHASTTSTSTTSTSTTSKSTTSKSKACKDASSTAGYTAPKNSGSPSNSSYVKCVNGQVQSYGSSAITYRAPPQSYVKPGEKLFGEYCSSCHMPTAGGSAAAPNLVGLGPAAVMFWVTTGRMPAATPLAVQAGTKPPRLNHRQAEEIAAFVNSLSPAAPFIPTVHTKHATVAAGADLFSLNCAACHTITGAGDALAWGTFAPTLHYATKEQIAEAIRTGPANMPRFTGNLSDAQVRDIVAYVSQHIQHPTNPGGGGLGGVGPVAEGFVGLLFGVGALMLVCFWIGDRSSGESRS